jgi:hypothetical protein
MRMFFVSRGWPFVSPDVYFAVWKSTTICFFEPNAGD